MKTFDLVQNFFEHPSLFNKKMLWAKAVFQGAEKRKNELIDYVGGEFNISKKLMLTILSFEKQTELIEEISQELDPQN